MRQADAASDPLFLTQEKGVVRISYTDHVPSSQDVEQLAPGAGAGAGRERTPCLVCCHAPHHDLRPVVPYRIVRRMTRISHMLHLRT